MHAPCRHSDAANGYTEGDYGVPRSSTKGPVGGQERPKRAEGGRNLGPRVVFHRGVAWLRCGRLSEPLSNFSHGWQIWRRGPRAGPPFCERSKR